MRLGIDVDITLVETGKTWWEWLSSEYSSREFYYIDDAYRNMGKLDYNLSRYFKDCSEDKPKTNPYDFWSKADLYDELNPLPNSVKVIGKLVEAGHEIVFISHSKKGHISSKVRWLKKWFPEADIGGKGGFIATKEKHFVDVDIMIDDRAENLLKFKDEVVKIYVETIYQDPLFDKKGFDFVSEIDNTWKSIETFLEDNDFI